VTAALDPVPDRPATLEQAAAQFESLLLAQMLKHARESGSGDWLGGGEDSVGATMIEVAEEHLAQLLSAQGGLGLAKILLQTPSLSRE
jgi:Rod binding domain-containing protein